ncbi:MAG: glycosyltransferase [Parcubacteria group bacterium]|nr:glycosyltransferase [Parcubacteria group bacterium]
MKILVSIYSLHRGGAERVVSRLSQEWAKEHEVVIALSDTSDIAYSYGGRIVDMDCGANENLLKKAYMVLRRVGALRGILKEERPDTVITFMEGASIPAIIACTSLGMLDILTVSVRNNPEALHSLYQPFMRTLYRLPGRIVVNAEGIRDVLLEKYYLDPKKIDVISNPLDLADIEKKRRSECVVAEVSSRTIIAAGRLVPQKGFDTLIRAYVHARKDERMGDTNLVIMGEGSERKMLEGLIRELHMEKNVTLPGAVENPFACFAKAGAFVLSSRMEGMPNVLLEAMASGVPVVSTDCKYGPSEIIIHEENGLLVPVDNEEALKSAIVRMMEADEKAREMYINRSYDMLTARSIKHIAPLWLV